MNEFSSLDGASGPQVSCSLILGPPKDVRSEVSVKLSPGSTVVLNVVLHWLQDMRSP